MLWARHCQKQLWLLQGVRDRASADAAAAEWDKEETLYYSNPVILVKDGESVACRLEQWYQLPQTYIDWHLNK